MDAFTALLQQALLDPFRIVLLIGLVITQMRTAAVTGMVLPLLAGIVFVAVILPATMGFGAAQGLPLAIAAGIAANVLLLVPILFVARLLQRRGR